MSKKIRVFLLDDHAIVRHGLRALLEAEDDFAVVGEAGTARDGQAGVVKHRPHVAVVDVRLPDGSGIDVVRHLRTAAPEVKVLVLSAFSDDATLVDAFAAGAAGYVLKQISLDALITGIRDVAAGKPLVTTDIASQMIERIGRQQQVADTERLGSLTPQERHILELIGEGLTNREIGVRLYLSEKTIKNNVTSLLSKLNVQRRAQAAALLPRQPR